MTDQPNEETNPVAELLPLLQEENAQRVQDIQREFPGLLDANMAVLLKIRLDAVTRVVFDIFENIGVKNADVAVNLTFEEAYRDFLQDLQTQARQAKITQGTDQLVVAKK